MKRIHLAVGGLQAIIATSALGADLPAPALPLKAPAASLYNWTGFYLGGHAGYGTGSLGPNTLPIPDQGVFVDPTVTGLIAGFQGGYNLQLRNNWVVGVEADISLSSPVDQSRLAPAPYNTTLDFTGTARARLGYAFGPVLPYVAAGLAFGQSKMIGYDDSGNPLSSRERLHLGWSAGAGVELAVGGPWSARIAYDYLDLGRRTYAVDGLALPGVGVDPKIQTVTVGLNYRLWDTPAGSAAPLSALPFPAPSRDWNVHGQTTFIVQGYPSIRSPYEGASSLPRGGQARETLTMDAFLGWRLWDGGEVYFNPELAQGFGLNGTLGIGGFPNGEAQKGGADYPKFRPQRYIFRQTFGLGGEQEEVADGPMQLAGKRDIDRVTLTVGRFAVGDYFDGNAYAKDPRADFMNWAIWSSGAYDFPADLPGFTRGAVVDLNRKDWAVRAGFFQVPQAPNSDVLLYKGGAGGVVEFEERHTILGQGGKLRFGVFANRGNTGTYRDALGIVAVDPTIAINDAMASIRENRVKYGYYANLEQAVTEDIGVFARWSWNDGKSEILSFTDIDRSLSGGVSIKGRAWGRPDDTIGIGGALNGLSVAHRDFLAAGGTGLLIGDGRINYSMEKILEAYYAWRVNGWSTVTLDYQFVASPAYNADRGPVSIMALRAHAEF
ncbi:carbohydrate porin [Bradyrhizobium sp. U87765 SZCCT0131]|uniref:carbohydrate porin n=1 Tax=unclassified Bradyrhizobium TaxID=2631580 RepID=UPI001BA5BFD8|nr:MULTISPECIES: carbohydrate porin [unclassified Bradyrhizobium]MBR1222290.1 carbohydrate porin [Bradyrhizobium sp. U87765 SZCCT0131]MBR1264226.1 carbohydrate porin [Bradyrhizobium sp. U87765 SZCCT0134]MBR1307991.1 carbohydrate porin [Bradyrhizobium sp. U87765 SZCCT0110]MBR1320476.1 carbohydrate porin [Bradyrhizobium sp. U87765 SZCCT0109]MBR1348411.1 carbohydrate porin [Bradyrhizobium sp. U87765 SZCCT0048]